MALQDKHDYTTAFEQEKAILSRWGKTSPVDVVNEKKGTAVYCSYCLFPLLPGAEPYYRPTKFNLMRHEVDLDRSRPFGHVSCIAAERIGKVETRLNPEMHVLHVHLRMNYNYYLPIVAAPDRELLKVFCGPDGLSVRAFREVLRDQKFLMRHEKESFYTPTEVKT